MSMGISRLRDLKSWKARAILVAGAATVSFLVMSTGSRAQQPPSLLPISPPSHFALFQVEARAPAQYEQELSVLDFEPGAWTYERRHNGMAFFSVVEGSITLRQGGRETSYVRGETFRQNPGFFYSMGNAGNNRTRVIVTTLTPPGQPAEANHPEAARPSRLPAIAFIGKTTWGNVPERFTLNQLIVDFQPGAGSGAHYHPAGHGLVIVMAGEHVHRLEGRDVIQKVGESFVDGPAGRPVSHENQGRETLRVVASYMNWGTPPSVPASIPGVAPPPAPPAAAATPAPALPQVRPPATGDGGLVR